MAKDEQPQFSFDTVAVLVSAMLTHGHSIGGSTYDMMSTLDGTRTANAFAHQFRAVNRRAKELKDLQAEGRLQPATPKSRGKSGSKKGTARPVKSASKKEKREAVEDDEGIDDADSSPPAKRVKAELDD